MSEVAKPAKRSWWIDKGHKVHCYANPAGDCHVTSLADSMEAEATSFYDADLARTTGEINNILTGVRGAKPSGRDLCFIVVENRPFLVWTEPGSTGPDESGAIRPDDDPQTVRRALGLKQEKPAHPHKRSWLMGPTHIIYCYANPAADCIVTSLWEPSVGMETKSFYDANLDSATKEINRILAGIKEKKQPGRDLSFIVVENRLFLVWTEPGAVGPNNDPQTVREALRLKEPK
ncbi:hypothetical protein [Pseudarthrobacter albicanus]|uniref:hypothetical protein n=1 Tax=Pseudarthrobacter albicanus TaxID=2823873 RepID=UPI001BAAE57E|nr:hypothetical protein [Pseudarthrobacter albicanus]